MKGQCLPLDIINMMPQNVIEMILSLMPIRDAARTSILSRKWRYNWVKIPKLVFDHKLIHGINFDNKMTKRCRIFYAIYQVLLLHKGPILEFTLNWLEVGNSFEQIIFLLSRNNTLKKFTFGADGDKLPSLFYSLKQLTHIKLSGCKLQCPSRFNGFKMLTSLSLDDVEMTEKVLLRLISGCPILKHFTLVASDKKFQFEEEYSIVKTFKRLNVIEHLELNLHPILWFFTGAVPRKLPTSLVHLKHLDISVTYLMDQRHQFSFTLLLIRSSPNLQKIKIEMDVVDDDSDDDFDDDSEEIDDFVVLQDYGDVKLDHLVEFEIIYYRNSTVELELLKLILVNSPVLKKVCLKLSDVESDKEDTEMLRSFLSLPRASPVVDIIVQRWRTGRWGI